jgi:general secretion pathway protein G
MLKPNRSRSGFSLLEIMLVVTIIGILLASAIKFMGPQLGIAKEARVEADLSMFKSTLLTYEGRNGFLPSSEQGLKALVARPESEPRPTQWRQMMEQLPSDPWGSEYVYVQPGTHNTSSYDLFSKGPDRKPNTPDDIGNWKKETK